MEDLHYWQEKFTSCIYSDRLIAKVASLNLQHNNVVNLTTIKKAIYYAKKYHGNQKRQTGEPYYSHPITVADMVTDFYFETNAIVAAILHDIIEDTEAKLEQVESIFGCRVAEMVNRLTRFSLSTSTYKISVEQLLMRAYALKDAVAVLIKLCDRLHNLQTLNVKNHDKQQKTYQEVLHYFYLLSFKLDQNMVSRFEYYLHKITPRQDHSIFSYGTYQLEFPILQNNF